MYLNRFVRAKTHHDERNGALRDEVDSYDDSNEEGLAARAFYEKVIEYSGLDEDSRAEQTRTATSSTINTPSTLEKTKPLKRNEVVSPLCEDPKKGELMRLHLLQINERKFRKKIDLFRFVSNGNIDGVVDILSVENEWIDITDDYGWTPLMCAVASGNVCMVELLLDMKANVYDIKDRGGQTAWDIAIKLDRSDVIDLLFDRRIKKEPEDQEDSCRSMKDDCVDNEGEFCQDCQLNVAAQQVKSHCASTAHLFNVYKQTESPAQYHLPSNNIGYRMLKDAGWTEEIGLGHDGSGKQQPISTVLKSDRSGLGLKGKDKKRVTHFKAYDASAIRGRKILQRSEKFSLKKEKLGKKLRSRQWEIDLRSYMTND